MFKVGVVDLICYICKPLAVQLFFLRVGEIHLNKTVCIAVPELSYALQRLVGHRFYRGRTVCVIKISLIHDFLFFMPLPLIVVLTCTISV